MEMRMPPSAYNSRSRSHDRLFQPLDHLPDLRESAAFLFVLLLPPLLPVELHLNSIAYSRPSIHTLALAFHQNNHTYKSKTPRRLCFHCLFSSHFVPSVFYFFFAFIHIKPTSWDVITISPRGSQGLWASLETVLNPVPCTPSERWCYTFGLEIVCSGYLP